jgi:hypothetical protein
MPLTRKPFAEFARELVVYLDAGLADSPLGSSAARCEIEVGPEDWLLRSGFHAPFWQ